MNIKKAEKNDLQKILELQYLAYQSEAKLFNNPNIPPLRQTLAEVESEYQKGVVLKAVDEMNIRNKDMNFLQALKVKNSTFPAQITK